VFFDEFGRNTRNLAGFNRIAIGLEIKGEISGRVCKNFHLDRGTLSGEPAMWAKFATYCPQVRLL
jgi:hypothetical protein